MTYTKDIFTEKNTRDMTNDLHKCGFYNWVEDHEYRDSIIILQHFILRDNTQFLTKVLGYPSFHTMDSEKRRLSCWVVELEKGMMILISEKQRGTTIEISEDANLYAAMRKVDEIFRMKFYEEYLKTKGL